MVLRWLSTILKASVYIFSSLSVPSLLFRVRAGAWYSNKELIGQEHYFSNSDFSTIIRFKECLGDPAPNITKHGYFDIVAESLTGSSTDEPQHKRQLFGLFSKFPLADSITNQKK